MQHVLVHFQQQLFERQFNFLFKCVQMFNKISDHSTWTIDTRKEICLEPTGFNTLV